MLNFGARANRGAHLCRSVTELVKRAMDSNRCNNQVRDFRQQPATSCATAQP